MSQWRIKQSNDHCNAMDINTLIEYLGDKTTIALTGLIIGSLFGFFAQRSRFCMRSAVVEFWDRQGASKLSIWLFAFATAVISTQLFITLGDLDVSQARQLSATGSLSGAVLGGLIFGSGMVLARGCSSRMLVLAANGNLRALLTGLIFAVTAQASSHGILSSLRGSLSGLWVIEDSSTRDLLTTLHLGHLGGVFLGLIWLAAAIHFARRAELKIPEWLGACAVGVMVALGWLMTYQIGSHSFEIIPVQSLSFTGPSADVLMLVLSPPGQPWDFNIGLVPGVVLGSFLAALWRRELKLEGFKDSQSMRRYIVGAICMGFGGMLAGGCAVGAGVSGASIFALTAWIALIAMWLGAGLTHTMIDRQVSSEEKSATVKLTVADQVTQP
jgi:uncharacterized protein